MKKYFMGISALHHDSAVCLIDRKGKIINLSQEERRTKIKNDKNWPQNSIDWSINNAIEQGYNITKKDITFSFYEYPILKFSRRIYANPKKWQTYFKEIQLIHSKIPYAKKIKHHESHALAGCATAPFDNGIFLTIDAIGEWNTTSWGKFNHKTGIKTEGVINYPHSIGLLYSAFTRWLGLKPNEDEYIVMGAAAYGEPTKVDKIWDFIKIEKNGLFTLTKDIHNGVEQYLGYNGVPIDEWYDWCSSIQHVCEVLVNNLVSMLIKKYGKNINLVLGGGVALNCVCNTKILNNNPINDIWILPSPGDSGNAIGAAAYAAKLNKIYWDNPYLGKEIFHNIKISNKLLKKIVKRLKKGEVIGWIQDREEFGPRALGHRSLLADPRLDNIKDKVNNIKKRQEFRPFAPSILEEKTLEYFDIPGKIHNHRYMQFISNVKDPKKLPGISHIDNTARIQTVPKSKDPFRKLLEFWYKSTKCPLLLNTSLNIKGQPLISEKNDAIEMLKKTSMDCLIIGNRLYFKRNKEKDNSIEYIDY